ncbi:AraC family transcriptional regulator [Paucibacter sp. KBW04]|uniref:AraC family transcriptional regulator n=1 Tax=Paucibacter sp. KBW04 TaxID=2153361 RepID=UPI000F5800F5|nr:AraC family transcriptional regulator [Paucibacter sp. KBW04]RQO63542.1 AraC family transcriptional regulator [Paucibacter sp. KBW04]
MAVQVSEHQSKDVDDQAKALNGWHQSYEQLGAGRFSGFARQIETPDGVLLREITNRSLREHISPPKDHIAIALPLRVDPGAVFAGRPLEANSLVFLNSEQEYDLVSTGMLDLVGLCVSREMVARSLPPAKLAWLDKAERERSMVLNADIAQDVRSLLQVLNQQSVDPEALGGNDSVGRALSHTVAMAMSSDGIELTAVVPRRADTRMKVVNRAVDFMRANLHNDIGVAEICAAACTSRRSLQYCFEEFLRCTPQAYLRALRLNEARRTLKLSADQPITSVATTLGFSSASHFTRHYRLMFEELPSETLKFNSCMPGRL